MESKNIFVINKPKGLSSNQVIQIIKKNLSLKKIGHGGTLDPLATGVLIIGINNGTKHLQHQLTSNKTYIATVEFGYSTDTYDIEGKVLEYSNVIPSQQAIDDYCKHLLTHDYYQEVPLYSAVKFKGKELYKYARNNQIIEALPKKLVKLIDYKIINYENKQLTIELSVSKGFYIRSFVNDLASYTNSKATMIALERTKSGDYHIDEAYTIEAFIDKYKTNCF